MEVRLQQVVATGCTDTLVAFRLALPAPVWEVTEVRKSVLVDRAEVILGSVLLQGRLRACYALALSDGRMITPSLGSPLPPGGITTWQTPLESLWADCAFCAFIPVAEAEPELNLTVLEAHVAAQAVQPAEVNSCGRLLAIDDQSLIRLAVRLTRWVDAHLPPQGQSTTRGGSSGGSTGRAAGPAPELGPVPPPTVQRPLLTRFRSP